MKTIPLYTEVYNKILEGIRNGEYSENAPLPAERFLCEKYHVSRSTLRTALMLLNKEGVVYTVAGAGTFIRPTYFVQPLKYLYSFADTLRKRGIITQSDIVSYNLVSADQTLMRKTKCEEGKVFHKLVSLRSTKENPLMIETSYLLQSRFDRIDLKEYANDSMYEFLEKNYNFILTKAVETFRSVMALPHEKELLQIYGNIPCMLVERFSYEEHNLVGYTKSIIRGDKFVFSAELE